MTLEKRLIVAGGRNHQMTREEVERLKRLCEVQGFTEIVGGEANGADLCGKIFAFALGLKYQPFEADWAGLGKAAGPVRNKAMANYADAVVLLKGSRGTESMYNEASRALMGIHDWR